MTAHHHAAESSAEAAAPPPPAGGVLDAILRASPDLFAVVDRDGRVLDVHGPPGWSPHHPWHRVRSAVRGVDRIPDVLPPGPAEAVMASVARVLETGEPDVIEVATDASGQAEWFESRRVWLDADTTLAIVRDVSDRHRAEAALRETLDRYERILDTMREAVLIIGADGTVTFASKAVERVVGLTPDEVVGHRWTDLLDPAVIEAHAPAVPTSDVEQYEFPTARKDGSPVWLHASVTRLVEDGEAHGFLVAFDDVTERRAVEQSRLELLERLETVAESERARLSKDLHDGPIQQLAAAAMRLGALRRDLDGELAERARELEETVLETVGSLRRTMFVLQGPELDRFGLGAALGTLAEQMLGDTGATWSVSDTLSTDPGGAADAAYRVAREALANVRAHASARHVTIALADAPGGFQIVVCDDGVGIEPDAAERPRAGHLGITAMRERAAEAGGTCKVGRGEPSGTVVTAWFPRPGSDDDAAGAAPLVP